MFRESLLFNYAFCFAMHIISHPFRKFKISPMAKVLKIEFFLLLSFLIKMEAQSAVISAANSLGNIIEI